METQNTLRDQLASAIEAHAEEPAQQVVVTEQPQEPIEPASNIVRDESGKFAKKSQEQAQSVEEPIVEASPKVSRPSTWKKDYWEKFDALDPELQTYINQRESEYKSGVSTYREEAIKAKELNEAIAPFIPTLQQNNINPSQWIRNLGNAHYTLVYGSPEQKVNMFQQLARDYGIDLGMQPPVADQQTQWLTQQVNNLRQTWDNFQTTQQQQEHTMLQQEISSFADSAPHFEAVRETMAGILQAGLAQDLQSAYDKAIRMHDDIWEQEQSRSQNNNVQQKVADAQKAKSVAVSPKSATPSGKTNTNAGKGLREVIAEQFNAASSRV